MDLTVSVDGWASEFSMDVVLPNGNVASFNSSSVSNNYHGVLVTFAGAGNYTIYLNDTYGDGGTSVSADYSYVSANNPPANPISGAYSARSGDISDSEVSTMEFTGAMSNGTVAFSYNVSSEANYDFLTFSIDGVQLAQWSGTQSNFSTPVSLGQHTLTWSYVKDGSVSTGSDGMGGRRDNPSGKLYTGNASTSTFNHSADIWLRLDRDIPHSPKPIFSPQYT